MTASVKTPIKVNTNKTVQPSQPSIKTPLKKMKISRESELGALWCKTPIKGGDEYMTGDILVNGVKTYIVVFRNKFKDDERKPDWRIYLDTRQSSVNKSPEESQNQEAEQDASFLA